MPFQAIVAEHVVGVCDRERALPAPLSVAEFNETVLASLPPAQRDAFKPFSDGQLMQVRELRKALEARWHALPAGATMEVEFPA
jgi:hypothetical protein